MKVIAECPWCYLPVEGDDHALNGGNKAQLHMKVCEMSPLRQTVLSGSTPLSEVSDE